MESLDISGSADDRFNFWNDIRETSDKKQVIKQVIKNNIKCVFVRATGKVAFALLKTLVYPKGTLPSQKFKRHFCVMSGLAR